MNVALSCLRTLLGLGAALCLLGSPAGSTHAQGFRDTTVTLPAVTVTATRTPASVDRVPTRVTLLDREAIASAGAGSVADLLGARSTLFLRRYGAGGLATASLRGLGAAQTLVLLDGYRIADPQLGQLDLSQLPTILLEGVEVMHGAGSSLYGTDGIGGVINLRTQRAEPGLQTRLAAGMGAYGERTGGLLVGGGGPRLSGLALAEVEAAEGDFPYVHPALFPARQVRRAGADRRRQTLYGALRYGGDVHRLRLAAWYNGAERGLPGLATTPPQGERQWDEHLRLWASDDLRLGRGSLRVGGLVQHGALRYQNPAQGIDQTGRTLLASGEAEARWAAGARWFVAGGLAGSLGRAAHPALAEAAAVTHTSAFGHGTGYYGRLLVYPALRLDRTFAAGRVQQALSPRLGLNAQPWPGRTLHLKASAGRSFRSPTLNDRYWQPGGNPDLRPEDGWTVDGGVLLGGDRRRLEVTLFAVHTRDQIVWQPTPAGHHAPRNVSRVRSLGLEAGYHRQWRFAPGGRVEGELIYSFTDARDRSDPATGSYGHPLRYVPRNQFKAYLGVRLGRLALDVHGRYTGRRYVTTDGTQVLDPYIVLDAQLRTVVQRGGLRLQLALLVENVLDADYNVLQYYPMPPRHARLRLLLETRSNPR